MKILHIGEYVKGGITTYINEVIGYQSNEGYDVHLMLSDFNSDETETFNIKESKIKRYSYKRNPLYFLKAMKAIHSHINELQPDIIHIHSSFAGMFVRLPLFVKKNKKIKIVYCAHGWCFLIDASNLKKLIYRLIERVLALNTDRIINISKYELEAATFLDKKNTKNVLINNGVRDVINLDNNRFMLNEEKINILFVGRFDKQKGIDILFENVKNLRKDIEIYFIGGPVLNDDFLIPDYIKKENFLGWVKNTENDSYIQKFDCIIVPSRWEGFGLVVIEAMRNSKAAIVSSRGALPELVIDGENGYVFDLNNPTALNELLDKLDKNTLKEMGSKARIIYENTYTSLEMNKKIIDLYDSLFK